MTGDVAAQLSAQDGNFLSLMMKCASLGVQ